MLEVIYQYYMVTLSDRNTMWATHVIHKCNFKLHLKSKKKQTFNLNNVYYLTWYVQNIITSVFIQYKYLRDNLHFFHAKSSKSSVYFKLRVQLNSDWSHVKCLIATCSQRLPY